ncbi:hypothetical protein ACI65C_001301 [Semiaphis heraclei]
MASSQGNPGKHNGPKDAQIIVSMMKDLGIEEYEPQVLNHLLEFNYRNATKLLEDAKTFSNFANKKQIDADDVRIAIKFGESRGFHQPPTHDILEFRVHCFNYKVLMSAAVRDVNFKPLPPVRRADGLRIPQDSPNFLQTNYRLRNNLNSRGNMRKDTKTTAAEMLEASRQFEINDESVEQSCQINNSLDLDLQEMIENRQSSQESIEEKNKDELMGAQACQNCSYSNIVLDDNVKK